ncbi:MAG: Rieske (2Fe-2S) protein [Caldilineaceae bacterium]|nr:Rieske (2Fe-2S) protein [Caldilineaceae bacterium]
MPEARNLQRWKVAELDEIEPGQRKVVDVAGRSIGVFNVDGEYIAVLNLCPHELAPLCLGRVSGTTLPSAPGQYNWGHDGEIVACPWHGWEFNLRSGECLVDRRKRLHHFPVVQEDAAIYVLLPQTKGR